MVTIYVTPRCKLCHAVVGCYAVNAAPTGLRALHDAVSRHLKAGHYIDSSKTVAKITGCQCRTSTEVLAELESLATRLMTENASENEDTRTATRLCVAEIRNLIQRLRDR